MIASTLQAHKTGGYRIDAEGAAGGQIVPATALMSAQGVRRLTPTECERLQGFPDDWALIPGAPDSRRYAAMGDAVTVPVAKWIGQRLATEEAA